jgi:NAD(P)-dependent dehydrogenase (short-subunit alcohol dehydrogenase family)
MHVIVTGASSGNGLAAALALARNGIPTFAGVRNEHDADAIRNYGITALEPLNVDIGSDDSVARAAVVVAKASPDGLLGLVNNAGIGLAAPIECVALADLRAILETNVIGQVRATQAFLPLLRRARGRIVNVTSVGAYVALPYIAPLNASKFAFRAINDALRQELASSGVRVVDIAPASINTPSGGKMRASIDRTITAFSPEQRTLYAASFRTAIEHGLDEEDHGSPPEVVGDAVVRAITDRRPRSTYFVGRNVTMLRLLSYVPSVLRDRLVRAALGL